MSSYSRCARELTDYYMIKDTKKPFRRGLLDRMLIDWEEIRGLGVCAQLTPTQVNTLKQFGFTASTAPHKTPRLTL